MYVCDVGVCRVSANSLMANFDTTNMHRIYATILHLYIPNINWRRQFHPYLFDDNFKTLAFHVSIFDCSSPVSLRLYAIMSVP